MIGPFKEVQAGGQISAAELNRLFQEVVRLGRIQVAPPLAITSDWQGLKIRIDMGPAMHVRITGVQTSGSAGSGSGAPGYFYSGIEQWSYIDGTIQDAPTGIHFFTNLTPLVEMAMMTTVPVNAIVLATRAASGNHWEFLWGGETGSGSPTTQACTKCCCCCVPCVGPLWLTIPAFGVDFGCNWAFGTGAVTFPAFMLQPEFSQSDTTSYPRCWSCSLSPQWIVSFGKVGDVTAGTINLTVKICCEASNLCPVLTVRGTYTIADQGGGVTVFAGVNPGTYTMCIGPISADTSEPCNLRNDESGGPTVWQARWTESQVNDCDRNNWNCACHTQLGGDIVCQCGVVPCSRTGIPLTFPVTIIDTGILHGGDIEFGAGGRSGTMTAVIGSTGNYACGQFYTGTVITASGCIVDVVVNIATDGTFDVSNMLRVDPANTGPCMTLLTNIITGDFQTMQQTRITCDPGFCLEFSSNSGAGPGIVRFGTCT